MKKLVIEIRLYHRPGGPVSAIARCKCESPARSFGGPRALEELLAHLRHHVTEYEWPHGPTKASP